MTLTQVGGAGNRAAKAAQLVQPRVVGLHVGLERLERHGGGDLGLLQPALGVVDGQRADPVEDVGAVDRGQAVARLEPGHRDAGALQGHGAGQAARPRSTPRPRPSSGARSGSSAPGRRRRPPTPSRTPPA